MLCCNMELQILETVLLYRFTVTFKMQGGGIKMMSLCHF